MQYYQWYLRTNVSLNVELNDMSPHKKIEYVVFDMGSVTVALTALQLLTVA